MTSSEESANTNADGLEAVERLESSPLEWTIPALQTAGPEITHNSYLPVGSYSYEAAAVGEVTGMKNIGSEALPSLEGPTSSWASTMNSTSSSSFPFNSSR